MTMCSPQTTRPRSRAWTSLLVIQVHSSICVCVYVCLGPDCVPWLASMYTTPLFLCRIFSFHFASSLPVFHVKFSSDEPALRTPEPYIAPSRFCSASSLASPRSHHTASHLFTLSSTSSPWGDTFILALNPAINQGPFVLDLSVAGSLCVTHTL